MAAQARFAIVSRPTQWSSNGADASYHDFKDTVNLCLRLLQPGRFILVLTAAGKVEPLVAQLRSETKDKLVGSLPNQEWLIPCLHFLVATPVDRLPEFVMEANAVVIDTRNCEFSRDKPPPIVSRLKQRRWFSTGDRLACSAEFRELLASELPEAGRCPGWGDAVFARIMHMFSNSDDNVVCQDWSGLVALIAGLITRAFTGPPALLVAPGSRVRAMIRLVQGCGHEMGIPGHMTSKMVRVKTMESVVHPDSRLVVVEANHLFEHGSDWIHSLLQTGYRCSVGLHATEMPEPFKQVVSGMCVARSPEASMVGVCHFAAIVESDGDKVDMVCRLWECLRRSSPRHYSIFCDSHQQVEEVVSGMLERGYEAYPIFSPDDPLLEEVYKHTFSVIVTNVHVRGTQDVINYGLPGSDEEYVKRVGRGRNDHRRIKLVINVGRRQELASLSCFDSMIPLPSDFHNLRDKLHVSAFPYFLS